MCLYGADLRLGGLEALFEIGQNVFDCLESNRQANEAWEYSR
jgi:hypothetical protein